MQMVWFDHLRCSSFRYPFQFYTTQLDILLKISTNKVVQNVKRMLENIMSICQYVRMLRYQNESCSKCHIVQNVIRMSERHYVNMSLEQKTQQIFILRAILALYF